MLMGFCAAGGLAVSLGECIGLSNELSSKDFFPEMELNRHKQVDKNRFNLHFIEKQ